MTLYEPIFAQFQEDCETYTPTREDNAFALKLSLSMSKFYHSEKPRAAQARADMGTYDLDFLAAEIDAFTTDGDLRWKEFCYAILEYKGEIGSTGAEPLFQAGWYYTTFTRKLLRDNLCSNFPCFLLYAVGRCFDIPTRATANLHRRRPYRLCWGGLDRSAPSASAFSQVASVLPCDRRENADDGCSSFWRDEEGNLRA